MPLLIDTWIGSSHSSCEYATVNIGVKCLCDVLTSSVKHPAGTHGILGLYWYVKHLDQKPSWREKGLFDLTLHLTVYH